MAFFNRIGSLVKQTNGQASMPSMLNTIRCMSSSKLFVGSLSYGTDEQSLREAFARFGDVNEAKVIIDKDTGRSRGFGFVNFSDTESASSALSAMDGQLLHGRTIHVSYVIDRPPRNNFGGSGSYGAGGGSSYGSGGCGSYGSGGGGSYGSGGGGSYGSGGGGGRSEDAF